jgi:hypothetical protein
MDLRAGDWVLVNGVHEGYVIRPDHFGNGDFALISMMSMGISMRYIPITRLTKLDPALYPFLESEYERVKSRRM